MNQKDITRLQHYLRETFGGDKITVKARKEAKDSAEVLLSGEFIGIIYKDEDDGDISFDFNMAILEMDLPKVA